MRSQKALVVLARVPYTFVYWLSIHTTWRSPSLTRNSDRDRADVQYLATLVPFDATVLRERYNSEMRAYLGVPEREALTLNLWIEIIQETQRRRS